MLHTKSWRPVACCVPGHQVFLLVHHRSKLLHDGAKLEHRGLERFDGIEA